MIRPRPTPYLLTLLMATLTLTLAASAESKEKVLYSFQGGNNDGSVPAGGVMFDAAGNLYGATTEGGAGTCLPAACGIVFELTPGAKKSDPWTETVLYIFKGNGVGDGNTPAGSVIMDPVGNLYGTTAYGGTGNCVLLGTKVGCGTVYELSPPPQKGGAWTETVLYSFPSPKEGYLPNGDLVFDSVGNLYGATMFGGGHGTTCDAFYQYCGAVFELSPPKKKGGKWKEEVLHGFRGGTDGANPNGGLVLDSRGSIYGTTQIGGNLQGECDPNGCGVVFEVSPPVTKGGTWSEKVLHRFNGLDGAAPAAGVVFDGNGDLYCTTAAGGGGNFPSGTVVQVVPHANGKWTAHILYSFKDGYDGGFPMAAVVFDASGNLYGTTTLSAPVGGGTVFRLQPAAGGSWALATLYDFTGAPDGSDPASKLIFGKAGEIFGTTQKSGYTGDPCGSYGCGTVFSLKP